ncbi:MAG: transporter [Adhaeribacter sp.]|nr:transporter [Adhaeribacter sp.]
MLVMAVAFAACTQNAPTKEEQLATLKNEQAALEQKITQLETELQAEGKGVVVRQAATPVTVLAIQPQTFRHYLEVQGKVDFDQNVAVSPKVPGVLTSVRVNRGDKVTKGQVLATIDASVLNESVQELRTSLELTKTVYEKQKRLWDQKIGTEIQYLTAKNNKESLERRLATLRQQQNQYLIKAPISGIVDEFNPKVGEAVNPASPLPVARIVNLSGTKVVADISETYAAKINKGDEAKIYLPDLKEEMEATVRAVSQAINTSSRSFSIELTIKNKGGQANLRPNMIAVVKIKDYDKEKATVVPVNVVQKDESSAFVFVAETAGKDTVVKKKLVTTGLTYNGNIEVLSGLAVNDKIISAGYQSLNEGQTITF